MLQGKPLEFLTPPFQKALPTRLGFALRLAAVGAWRSSAPGCSPSPPVIPSVSRDLDHWALQAGNAADTAVRGCPSLAQPLETESERTTETGRQRKDPSGTTTTMTRPSAACSRLPHASQRGPVPREHSRLEKKRASIASSSKIGSRNETSSRARSCRCRAVSVNRAIAVSRERGLCDRHFVANLRPMGAASRKSRKNLSC